MYATTAPVSQISQGQRFKLDGEAAMMATQAARQIGEKVVIPIVGGIVKVHRSVLAELLFD